LTRAQAEASLAEARELIDRRDYPSARGVLRAVVPAAKDAGWLDIDSDANFVVGETLDRERAPREAADAYERAYAASRRLGDRPREIRNLNALSNALLDAGAHERASATALEASSLARGTGDVRAEATALNNIAEAHRLAGRLAEARTGYERALGLARQSGDQAAIASILINLGSAERRAGRLADARARFAEAQDLAKGLNDPRAGEYVQWHLNQIEAELSTRGGPP
jgi:tetratricopeptide (TPR) repeat protein